MGKTRAVLALDIGGSKLASAVVTLKGTIIQKYVQPTHNPNDGVSVFNQLVALSRACLAATSDDIEVISVGVGVGGPMILPEGVVSTLNIPGWRDFPLKSRLQSVLGLPIYMDNDAKAFALGQYMFGEGKGSSYMMGIILSTGVGGGIIASGKLLHGKSYNAGHIGHMVVEQDGPRCACGGRGCLEAIASGPSIAKLYVAALHPGSSQDTSQITSELVARKALQGDENARKIFERAGTAAGRAIASAASLLDIPLFVLGGGVMRSGDLILDPLIRTVRAHAKLSFLNDLEIRVATDPAEAALIGAASLAISEIIS